MVVLLLRSVGQIDFQHEYLVEYREKREVIQPQPSIQRTTQSGRLGGI